MTGPGFSPAPPPWPRLRNDLSLHSGPVSRHGAPTWTLYDPVAYKFYRLGWLEFEILSRWHLGDAEAVARAVNRETTISLDKERVELVRQFVVGNDLGRTATAGDSARLLARKQARKNTLSMWLLKNYIFFRITLLRPDKLLKAMLPYLSWVFSPGFVVFVACTALLGILLIFRQWTEFRASMAGMFTPQGAAFIATALMGVKVVHEFGHGLAARWLGCRVPAMGVAFMVFYPLFWTDTSEAWKLKERWKRLVIDAAGILAELALAAVASVAWALLPDSNLRTAAYVLAGTTWIMTLAVNANPLMRFDGYYLLSDLLDEPDLQTRSFALAKWRLRELLFGFNDPPPLALPAGRRRLLMVYAFKVWLYRFFLFLGISLIVYHFFFKALGVFLMLLEVCWFIALPIGREMKQWKVRASQGGGRLVSWRMALLLAVILGVLAIPWGGRISAPALLRAEQQAVFYSPRGAMVLRTPKANNQAVAGGETILELQSPDLEHDIATASRRLETLRAKVATNTLERGLMRTYKADRGEMEGIAADLAAMLEQRKELVAAAPFDGLVTDMPETLLPGTWVREKEPLGVVVGGNGLVSAYVNEGDLENLRPGDKGFFRGQGGRMEPLEFVVESVDPTGVREVSILELSSLHGGPLPVRRGDDGTLVPERSVYRVTCRVLTPGTPVRVLAGNAVVQGRKRSLLGKIWRRVVQTTRREGGL